MLPEGQQDDFSKSFCALFWFWWFYWRACCSFFRSWWLFSIWFRGARAKSKKPSDVTFLILAILLTRIAFFGFGYCFQSDCFVVRAREASSLRQSSARSLKTTHTVYHEQSSFVSITTSLHRRVNFGEWCVGVPCTFSGLRCDRLLRFSSGSYEQRKQHAARGINASTSWY